MKNTSIRRERIDLKGVKFMISAEQMDRAVEFYRDTFGLGIKTHSPFWSELTFGNAIVALHGGGDDSFNETGLSFTVADIHSACRAIEECGGSVRSEPEDRGDEGIYLAMVTDTENNGFMLSQDKTHSA
ncbi:MAG: hypothetical protein OXG24_05050 [Gammaproteobacteria bacterium]|nr:hypothetical protein [Gammaproteobacteria bacterium]